MTITSEMNLRNFVAWSGAIETQKVILENGKEEEFVRLVDDSYPDGLSETQLNDILWFEEEWIYECLDIEVEKA